LGVPPKPATGIIPGLNMTLSIVVIAVAAVVVMLVIITICCCCCGKSEDTDGKGNQVSALPKDSVDVEMK